MKHTDIIRDGEIFISEEDWIRYNEQYDKEYIKQVISDAMGVVSMPLKPITEQDALNDFKALQALDTTKLIKTGKIITKRDYKYEMSDTYIEIARIGGLASDYFHQASRHQCDSLNSPSPYRVWTTEKFRKNMLKNLWTMPTTQVDSHRLRAANSLRNYKAPQFRPSAAKALYDHFNSRIVLDFSAGWGDRMAGFYATERTEEYLGIDVNSALFQGYQNQKTKYHEWCRWSGFNYLSKGVRMFKTGAEEIKLPTEYFDTVFTSPPYFDIERYSKDPEQSWKRYKKFDEWLNKFLLVAVEHAWKALKKNGVMAINISDVYSHHEWRSICDPMNDFISKLKGAEYQGGIGYKIPGGIRGVKLEKNEVYCEPIWVWKKKLNKSGS